MTDKEKIKFKNSLKEVAMEILQKRITTSSAAMSEAQKAANEEGKSSVGDKYETSRAMAQIDRDIHAKQLESAQKDLNFLQHVDVSLFCSQVEVGAFVVSGSDNYFFLTGLGPLEVNGQRIFYLSISSPIGKIFAGKKSEDRITFNGKEILIKELF